MDKQQRITRTQIQGIVNMVFDICDKYGGAIPEPEDFNYAITLWIEEGKALDNLAGIPNKRLPIPEINICIE